MLYGTSIKSVLGQDRDTSTDAQTAMSAPSKLGKGRKEAEHGRGGQLGWISYA